MRRREMGMVCERLIVGSAGARFASEEAAGAARRFRVQLMPRGTFPPNDGAGESLERLVLDEDLFQRLKERFDAGVKSVWVTWGHPDWWDDDPRDTVGRVVSVSIEDAGLFGVLETSDEAAIRMMEENLTHVSVGVSRLWNDQKDDWGGLVLDHVALVRDPYFSGMEGFVEVAMELAAGARGPSGWRMFRAGAGGAEGHGGTRTEGQHGLTRTNTDGHGQKARQNVESEVETMGGQIEAIVFRGQRLEAAAAGTELERQAALLAGIASALSGAGEGYAAVGPEDLPAAVTRLAARAVQLGTENAALTASASARAEKDAAALVAAAVSAGRIRPEDAKDEKIFAKLTADAKADPDLFARMHRVKVHTLFEELGEGPEGKPNGTKADPEGEAKRLHGMKSGKVESKS